MDGSCGEGTAINSFSLVAYLPEPLSSFIEGLRQQVQPRWHARAHLTLLPPRPLGVSIEEAQQQVELALRNQPAFRVQLGEVCVFPVTQVVYLSVSAGVGDLTSLHGALNSGGLQFLEIFQYHPHVTLAQDLPLDAVSAAADLAGRRWRDFAGHTDFLVENLTLVQNTRENRWNNVGTFTLRTPVIA